MRERKKLRKWEDEKVGKSRTAGWGDFSIWELEFWIVERGKERSWEDEKV
jgi:hypothetical protein